MSMGEPRLGGVRELKGIAASRGVATGKVKVVVSPADFSRVEEGDILVAKATDPSYVLVLGKVSAVVTEYGGVCSHAAIVSRELGIPCVVGIEGATKLLKDGMLVEVDGNEGRVRILD